MNKIKFKRLFSEFNIKDLTLKNRIVWLPHYTGLSSIKSLPSEEEIYYYAVKNTKFEPNYERTQGTYSKYSSIDDQIDPFHYYTTLVKFGIGRTTYDAAHEIRNKKITREEGIKLVMHNDHLLDQRSLEDFNKFLGYTAKDYWGIVEKFWNREIFEKVDDIWRLNKQIKLRRTFYETV